MKADTRSDVLRTLVSAALVSVALAACGGGGGGGAAAFGVFSDDPVEGLSYSSVSGSGQTDARGIFSYGADGDRITFSIGGVTIGDGNAQPLMTPVDLVKDDDPTAVDETNDRVANITRFLQTIDDDGDPLNGILITQAVRDAAAGVSVEFAQTIAAFEGDTNVQTVLADLTAATTAGARGLVPVADAQARLHATLMAALTNGYAGTVQGFAVGDVHVSGTFALTVDANGAVIGVFRTSAGGAGMVPAVSIPLFGEIGSSGAFTLTSGVVEGMTLTLEGTFSGGGVFATWNEKANEQQLASGTLTGAADGGGPFYAYHIGAAVTSNPEGHADHFDGALCLVGWIGNSSGVTVDCAGEGINFTATGARNIGGPQLNALGTGLYAGVPTAFAVSALFEPAHFECHFHGTMSAGTDGTLPDGNGDTQHEPIEVGFSDGGFLC